MSPADLEQALAEEVAACYADPLRFVKFAFPWREPGPLKDYDGPDTWQADVLREIGAEVRARKFDGQDPVAPIRFAIASGHGVGKALSDRTVIPTPTGERAWGTLVVGDLVFAEDGTPTRVTGVYPQGDRQMFRVVFDDGTAVEADGEHLWKVRGRQERRNKRAGWRTLTTEALALAGVQRSNGAARARQWEVPQQGEAHYPPRIVPVPPYVLGAWLGDGGRGTGRITSADTEVVERIRSLGEDIRRVVGSYAWSVRRLGARLRALGVGRCYSYEKRVPRCYLENDAETRAEVLRGLLDTDGECNSSGVVIFNSTSAALAADVVWLARSLGGKARIQPTVKSPTYRGPNGEKKQGRPCWRVTLTMPRGTWFYVARKQARMRPIQPRYLARWIDRIEVIGTLPARCITVAHPSRCFLANDFVVTHNSAMSAWLAWWILSTRPHSQGTVTANTVPQLQTKTWAAVQKWGAMCLTRSWFDITSERVRAKAAPESWFLAALASREESSEAFAGQHAASSTSWYLFDEASAIPDVIWEVAEGGMSDGEPMMFVMGNPTRTSGRFHAACFGSARDRWKQRIIDSRDCRFPNKDLIAEWERDYGEDSDFFRVRVRGLPPRAADTQFIGSDLVFAAQHREVVPPLPDEPLIVGLDVARGGGDICVFRFRRGRDATSIPPVKLLGEESRDSMRLVSLAADVLTRRYRAPTWPEHEGVSPAVLCVDATGVGGPIADRLKQLGHKNVVQVQFGGSSPEPQCENMRAAIWARLREWLEGGCIDRDPHLEADLTSIGYGHNKRDKLVLESKESMKRRGVDSPDHADALALTFAVRAASAATLSGKPAPRPTFGAYPSGQGWMA